MSGLAKESAEEIPSYSLHMADSGTDNFDRDFALSLLSSDQDAIYEIEEALKRIERNTYGICELTGKLIPKTRLEAIPWTRFTVQAQAQLEREGALRQRRLGSLGTADALDFKNINLLRQFVTDQGRILPRKYTGLPAHYQRRLNRAIKRARQMLMMK